MRGRGYGRSRLALKKEDVAAMPKPPVTVVNGTKITPQAEINAITDKLAAIATGGRYVREPDTNDSGRSSGKTNSSEENLTPQQLIAKHKAKMDEERERADNEEFQDFTAMLQPCMQQLVKIGDFQGKTGQRVPLTTNFVRCDLDIMHSKTEYIYQYRVDFKPITDNVEMKKQMVAFALSGEEFSHVNFIFEGTMIFTFAKLNETEDALQMLATDDRTEVQYTISFNLSNTLLPNNPLGIQMVNLINRDNCKENLGFEQVQRNFFMKSRAVKIETGHKIFEVWPGYSFSINIYEAGMFLCANVRAKVLPKHSVLDVMKITYREITDIAKSRQWSHDKFLEEFRREVIKRVAGIQVRTMFNNKTYRVDDVDFRLNPISVMHRPDGEILTYKDYYDKVWNYQVADDYQPLLISRPKKRQQRRAAGSDHIYLLPEICQITGLDEKTRKDFAVMRDLAVHTRKSPVQRSVELRKFIAYLNGADSTAGMDTAASKATLAKWGLKVGDETSPDLLQMEGRELPPEPLIMRNPNAIGDDGKGKVVELTGSKEGDWDKTAKEFNLLDGKPLNHWIFICTDRDFSQASTFFSHLKEQAKRIGADFAPPTVKKIPSDNKSYFVDAITKGINEIHQQGFKVEMVFCLLPNRKADTYAAIKKVCFLDNSYKIPSQCVLIQTIRDLEKQVAVATKVAMQMNCKLGGEPWMVKQQCANTVIIGIDTYHDTDRKGRNITGFVSSLNKNCTQWYSQVCFQSSKQEISDGLTRMMAVAMAQYKVRNQVLPERVVIYRDGVGDGQLQYIHEHELPQINAYIDSNTNWEPQLAYIVLKKRINQRFFRHDENAEEQNPFPGTIVDSKITRRDMYDFLLVSQKVRQGTVTPVHYNIIYDTTRLGPDKFQRLSYKLTHLYFNWPGTVRVPAPCQYAHKLATLVGDHLHQEVSCPDLCQTLYYL